MSISRGRDVGSLSSLTIVTVRGLNTIYLPGGTKFSTFYTFRVWVARHTNNNDHREPETFGFASERLSFDYL